MKEGSLMFRVPVILHIILLSACCLASATSGLRAEENAQTPRPTSAAMQRFVADDSFSCHTLTISWLAPRESISKTASIR